MAVYDIYSKRRKRLAGGFPDIYTYEAIPLTLRNQIAFIADDIVEDVFGRHQKDSVFHFISRTLSREWGQENLVPHGQLFDSDR